MEKTLSRSEKIEAILDIVGVPDKRELARKNYEKLSDTDIDARLERLRKSAARVEKWRKTRAPAVPRQTDSARERLDQISAQVGLAPLKPSDDPAA